jgi:hypothetical protein
MHTNVIKELLNVIFMHTNVDKSKNKVKQNLKQSKGCVCEKLPSQKSSTSSPATAPEKLDGAESMVYEIK